MQISVTGRHVDISNRIKPYAEEKVAKLPRYYDRVKSVEVIVEKEADLVAVEMIVKADHREPFVAKETGPDAHACIDLLMDKMERQLTRHKERFRNRKHGG